MKENKKAWDSTRELDYQLGFDKPAFLNLEDYMEKPKQPTPTKPIRRRVKPEIAKKHIRKDGK